jgi:hypothetical protein
LVRALDDLLLFFVPFVVFAGFLLLQRRKVFDPQAWRGPMPWLVIAGLLLVIAVMLGMSFFDPRSTGAYVPPHLENGRLVPGTFK